MAPIVLLLTDPAVLFAGIFLIALAIASSAATRPHQENPGITSAFTWATDLIGNLWHRIVRSTVSHFAAAHLAPVVRWFSGLNALAIGVAATAHDATTTVANALERLTGHTIPHAVNAKVNPIKKQASQAHSAAAKAQARAASTSTALTHYKVATNKKVAHATIAVDHKIPTAIGHINTEIDRLSSDAKALRERTKSLENGAVKTFEWIRTHPLSGVTGVFAGAIAVALARLGFGFLRCRSWQGVARKLTCGMAGLLDDLLFLAITAFAASDLCGFADAVHSAAVRFEPELIKLVDIEEVLVGCHGSTVPPGLSLPPLGLPPTNLGLSLAA